MDGGKTVEGIEGLLYITNGLNGEELEDHITYMMYEYPDEVVYAALDLRGEWVSDSNNPISLGMEKQVAEFLGLQYRHYSSTIRATAVLTNDQRRATTAIYDVTQRLLNGKEVSHVIVYRGFSWPERPEWVDEGLQVGQFVRIDEQRTLSSWSFSREIAEGFVSKNNFGFVVKATIPADRVFAIIDITWESESVCISHDGSEEHEVVLIKGGGTI